jgi:hypothetical protein
MNKTIDITGQKFGKLLVIEKIAGKGKVKWRCKCDCGRTSIAFATNLLRGLTKSCRCNKAFQRTLPGDGGSFSQFYIAYRTNAKTRGHSFELTKDEAREISSKNCHYCGALPTPYYAR